MRIRLLQAALLIVLFYVPGRVSAQTLPPPPRLLPPETRPAPPVLVMPPAGRPIAPIPLPPVYYRPSAYRVWEYYGRTYSGSFRPRVIDATGGGYYLYQGIPFPWVRNYPGEYITPLARD